MPANLLFPFNVSNKDLNNQGRGSINQSPELINQVQGRSENPMAYGPPGIEFETPAANKVCVFGAI